MATVVRAATVFKYSALLVLFLVLLLGAIVLWLRYELARVESPQDPLKDWRAIAVSDLSGSVTTDQDCDQQYPQRRALFGALHVHSAVSYDATSFGARTSVEQAYRFGRGEPVALSLTGDDPDYTPPTVTISSPLDFMAVTDHAEKLGETSLCLDPEAEGYDALVCNIYRGDIQLPVDELLQPLMRLASFAIFGKDRATRICGPDGAWCRERAGDIWRENQRVTDTWHDTSSACEFTTLHGYEYTLAEQASNLHRNVIFRSSTVPQWPLSSIDARSPEIMWEWMKTYCIDGNPDCDVLSIPHNSNWSSGRMWHPYANLDLPEGEKRRQAALRAELEPLAEIMQVKGDSECRNGLSSVLGGPDEFCDFEKLRSPSEQVQDCGESMGSGGMMLKGCLSRYNYVRYALTAGLKEAQWLGFNPFKLGIVAASDTHNGAPLVAREADHQGSHGTDRKQVHRLKGKVEVPGDIATGSPVRYNPGGIAGVYATSNSRAAIFDAMQQRETFGTSGPRIQPRFFAGWELPDDLCAADNYLETAYAQGVPMGGDLPPAGDATGSPVFVASATGDPRGGANLLQRIQVVKGWVDSDGRTHQAIYDVAGGDTGARVDPDTCAVSGTGYGQLCATWRDPDFDRTQAAVYYTRVLENPSCRWSRHDCLSLPETERPPSCSDPDLPWQIQERAWTSPIWYQPGAVL